MYRAILRQGWEITKKNKILLFFGFFTAFLGNGGAYEVIIKNYDDITNSGARVSAILTSTRGLNLFQADFWANIQSQFISEPSSAIFIVALFLLLILAFLLILWIIITSQVALVKAIPLAQNEKKLRFREIFSNGRGHFWQVLCINILTSMISWIILFFTGLFLISPFSSEQSLIITFLVFLVFFILNILISLTLYFITVYAVAYMALQKRGLKESLLSALKLFKENWLTSLEMAFLLFMINITLSVGSVVVGIIMAMPFFLVMTVTLLSQATIISGFMLGAIFLIFIGLFIGVGSFLGVYQTACWILLFEKISRGEKMHRLFSFVKEKLS